MQSGETTDEGDESRADSYLCTGVLHVYYEEAELALGHLRKISDDKIAPHIKDVLIQRWEQIKDLIRSAHDNGINSETHAYLSGCFILQPHLYK